MPITTDEKIPDAHFMSFTNFAPHLGLLEVHVSTIVSQLGGPALIYLKHSKGFSEGLETTSRDCNGLSRYTVIQVIIKAIKLVYF